MGYFIGAHSSTYSIFATPVAGSNDSGSQSWHDSSIGTRSPFGPRNHWSQMALAPSAVSLIGTRQGTGGSAGCPSYLVTRFFRAGA